MQDVIKQIEAIFEKEGYTDITLQSSAHSHTLSAQKGDIQAVVHLTNRQEVPLAAYPNADVPRSSDIRVKATVPGVVTTKPSQMLPQGPAPRVMGDSGAARQRSTARRK